MCTRSSSLVLALATVAVVTLLFAGGVDARRRRHHTPGGFGKRPDNHHDSVHPEHDRFRESGIVPDIIPQFFPASHLHVSYDDHKAEGGELLTPTLTEEAPDEVHWDETKMSEMPSNLFTLMLVNPDTDYSPDGLFVHWMVVNVNGEDVDGGDEIIEYLGPIPREGEEPHRLIFLVFIQMAGVVDVRKIDWVDANTMEGRANFGLLEFSTAQHLAPPFAGDFFKSEWDESVAARWERLGLGTEGPRALTEADLPEMKECVAHAIPEQNNAMFNMGGPRDVAHDNTKRGGRRAQKGPKGAVGAPVDEEAHGGMADGAPPGARRNGRPAGGRGPPGHLRHGGMRRAG